MRPAGTRKKIITRKQNREKETHFLFSFFVHLPSKSETKTRLIVSEINHN